nr:PREDICTED: uncharacterized protein LOC108214934 isoform X1 [Daucus carota subsp. sativus]
MLNNVDMMNGDVATLIATTDSVTSVVAAKEEVKQAVGDDLNSKSSIPCEWSLSRWLHGRLTYSLPVKFELDRFILNRPAMDFNYAHYMLTEARKGEENPAVCSKTNLQCQWRLSK